MIYHRIQATINQHTKFTHILYSYTHIKSSCQHKRQTSNKHFGFTNDHKASCY
ncbi:hypothetical protein Hanom_Chr16g01454781 [Helianthus anomalus]